MTRFSIWNEELYVVLTYEIILMYKMKPPIYF